LQEYFSPKGTELEAWTPTDWKENPSFLDLISDPDLKQWGAELNNIWKILGRKMKDEVSKNPEYYSIIPVPNPVIIPHSAPSDSMTYLAPDITLPRPTIVRLPIARRRTLRRIRRLI